MHLRKLHIKNLKLLKDLELDFCDPRTGEPRMWTVLVGRNGRGKTSVLQAIALAAAGRSDASDLAGRMISSFYDRRQGIQGDGKDDERDPVEIEATFVFPRVPRDRIERHHSIPYKVNEGAHLNTRLELSWLRNRFTGKSNYREGDWGILGRHSSSGGFSSSSSGGFSSSSSGGAVSSSSSLPDPLEEARAQDIKLWFVSGYGVGRGLNTSEAIQRPARKSFERLRSLFEPVPLIGIGFADLFPDEISRKFSGLLKKTLLLSPDTVPEITDVTLSGGGGVKSMKDLAEKDKFTVKVADDALKIPATWLSHGYQSSLAWLADLIGQYFLEFEGDVGEDPQPEHLSGLVLIDELDLFLHPEWQVSFIKALRETFPNLQFVVTTHSPLLVSALPAEEIVVLDLDDGGNIVQGTINGDPRLMTSSELYRSIFGVRETPPTEYARKVSRYNYLAQDPYRDDDEDEEVMQLKVPLSEAGIDVREPTERKPDPDLPLKFRGRE